MAGDTKDDATAATEAPATLMDKAAELARDCTPDMSVQQQGRGFAVVLARLQARVDDRGRRVRLGVLATATTLAACVFLFALVHHPKAPPAQVIRYQVESGEILDGGYLRAVGNQGMALLFSEGTRLQLLPGARGRLRSVDSAGARFAIEQGPARIEVRHRPGATWLVDAGPFLITVHGTVFTVAWNPTNEQLDLRMEKGLVSVSGPVSEAGIAVRGGQHLTIDLPKKEVLLRELGKESGTPVATPLPARDAILPTEQATIPTAGSPAAAPEAVASATPTGSPRAGRPQGHARGPLAFGWAADMTAGRLDKILADVARVGLKRALAEASNEDLSALADAARYRRQDDIAEQALLGQRSRFPGSARASEAAFLLGRMQESRDDGGTRALEWYDSYLQGNPTGAYASEALGRKMIVTQKLLGNPAARAIAAEYLDRFPTGTYAGAARAFEQAP
jgi:TolA-binding protein/ferric-dicitrate binding protein FerR (iron transport regulator)